MRWRSAAVLRPFDRQADAVQRRGPAPQVIEDAAGRPGTPARLMLPDESPIGMDGTMSAAQGGLLEWRA